MCLWLGVMVGLLVVFRPRGACDLWQEGGFHQWVFGRDDKRGGGIADSPGKNSSELSNSEESQQRSLSLSLSVCMFNRVTHCDVCSCCIIRIMF